MDFVQLLQDAWLLKDLPQEGRWVPWLHRAIQRISDACQSRARREKRSVSNRDRAVKAEVASLQGLVQSFHDSLFIRGQLAAAQEKLAVRVGGPSLDIILNKTLGAERG